MSLALSPLCKIHKKAPWINWWILYKVGDTIFVQNHLLVSYMYKEVIGEGPFTPDTCYNYIDKRITHTDDGRKISEWNVKIDYVES